MMSSDMTYSELKLIKSDINLFINRLSKISNEYNHYLTQSEKDFYIYISKHIIFFKHLYKGEENMYFFKVIISDMYYYILSILKNETRYIYLNERSIIENYTRAVVRKTVEEEHITDKIFLTMKEIDFKFDFTEEDYSLIKSEYTTSCGYIHGSSILEGDLSFVLEECLENRKFIKDESKYYERIRRIFKIYDKMLISQYGDFVSSCFHRRKSIFEYLLGKDCLDLLFNVTEK